MRSSTASSRFFSWSARSSNLARLVGAGVTGLTGLLLTATLVSPANAYGSAATEMQRLATITATAQAPLASKALAALAVKGRAPKTGYDRALFGDGWGKIGSCDTRNFILKRDLTNITWRSGESCTVATGVLHDPYTGKTINFVRGVSTSLKVQVDHVVPVSDAWQKGAQQWTPIKRVGFYNDPLNLLAVDGPTNSAKGDGDAATWLPPQKAYRCKYVARQVAVKVKWGLWVTAAEKSAIAAILATCPTQKLPLG